MANHTTPRGTASSLSGRPQAFSHVKGIGAQFKTVASGEREKATVRVQAPPLKKEFGKAHEGPREKLTRPKPQLAPRPHGSVVQAVHAKVEREKAIRNAQRNLQMKRWRERRVAESSRVATRNPVLKKTQPDVIMKAAKDHSLRQALQGKRSAKRGRGSQSR